jgi:NDP-sugar pyrophosphorylase family protein
VRAVVVAGGKGVRLRPYTTTIPKPLVPIGNECSIIEILLRQLARHGFTDVTLAINHLGHIIRGFIGDGSRWGVNVDYWEETTPLGTIGPILEHLDEMPEHFVVTNADLLCSIDLAAMYRQHVAGGAGVTLASHRQRSQIEYGVLHVDGNELRDFEEKPTHEYLVNMGIYVVAREALRQFTPGEPLGFDTLARTLLADGPRPQIFEFDGYWLDIGRPEDYDRANVEFAGVRDVLLGTSPAPLTLAPVLVGERTIDLAAMAVEGASAEIIAPAWRDEGELAAVSAGASVEVA